MANSYTKLYIQIIFAVKGRQNLIKESFREDVEKYICGIISNRKSKPLSIYCNPDHTHVFLGLNPVDSISDLTREIKSSSSKYINESNFINKKFNWQNGYGAFSYSNSHIDRVVKYIKNQPNHHKNKSFREEYLELLKDYDIEYDEKYLFTF